MSTATLYVGDALEVLRTLPDEGVQCCVTSPPYWGLRDYGIEGQLGLERTPEEYVSKMVNVCREVRRVLRDDGTLWLNMGDCYATGAGKVGDRPGGGLQGDRWAGVSNTKDPKSARAIGPLTQPNRMPLPGLKPKDLVMMPARVAMALQADGWWLRSDIIWSKPNPMPESVKDRPTRSHEYVFLLTKSARYYYDAEAIRTEAKWPNGPNAPDAIKSPHGQGFTRRAKMPDGWDTGPGMHGSFHRDGREKGAPGQEIATGANARSVWEIATQPYPEAHFATFPEELARRCIVAGSSNKACGICGAPWWRLTESSLQSSTYGNSATPDVPGGNDQKGRDREFQTRGFAHRMRKTVTTTGWEPRCAHTDNSGVCTVLDPFGGSGTVAAVAVGNGRQAIHIDLNPEYLKLARQRIGPMFCEMPI